MAAQARANKDIIQINCAHPTIGTIITGSDYTFVDGEPIARVTDKAVCSVCGEVYTIIQGSPYSFADGKKKARVDDHLIGTCNPGFCIFCPHGGQDAVIITGSDYTDVGGSPS